MSEISEKEVEAAREAWREYWSDVIGQYEDNKGPMEGMRRALEAAARVRAEANAGEPVADEKLPCDVQLPGVKLKRGVRLSTLLMAIRKRKDWPEEQTKLPRMSVAAHPAPQPSVKVKPLDEDDYEEIISAATINMRKATSGIRGQMVTVQDSLDWWVMKETERRILSALTAGKPHPDDEAVDRFAAAMKAKLKWEREERGRHGWNDPSICPESYLARLLIEHLAKGNDGNFEDVANFCMMLHQRGAHPRVLADALTAGKPEPASGTDYFGSLVERARASATKASAKFPQPNYVTLKIAEEAGEVIRGAVHYAERRMEWSEVEGEIIQLLAMLIRFVTEGDQVNGIVPPTPPTAGCGDA